MNELPKKGDLIAGKYTIEGILGQGGMGAVFEVCHRLTGKHFAVKWLLPSLEGQNDAVQRFLREAQVAGRVDHPNVVEVYDVGQEGSSFFMVMELLQGEPLSRRLDRMRRLSLEETCRILLPVMHGLAVAHAAGVIHRDLKPDNIFLCRTPLDTEVPKVLDFGISKMSTLAGEVAAGVTRVGLVVGTPQYMSPEQLRGVGVDQRSDIYALGVILYEMLGGSVPFAGDNLADVILTIMHEQPKPLGQLAPGLPPQVWEIVRKALSRDPNARFSKVEELGRALAAFSGGFEFAADTGDPTRLSASQQRMASAQRLRTPFSTEMKQALPVLSPADDPYTRRGPTAMPMLAGVGIAALAVVALGAAAYMLATQNRELNAQGPVVAPPAQGPAAEPARADIPPTTPSTDLPVTDTIRVGPELPGDRTLEAPSRNEGRNDGNDGHWNAQGAPQNGVVDPADLRDSNVNRIRLSGRKGVSTFEDEPRSRKRARKSRDSGSSRAPEASDPPEPAEDRQEAAPRWPGRFRGSDPSSMTPDDF